jgi:hypothetical protein
MTGQKMWRYGSKDRIGVHRDDPWKDWEENRCCDKAAEWRV